MPNPALSVGALALALACVGCSDDGRSLAPAPPTTAATAPVTPATPGEAVTSMRITSPDLTEDGTLDRRVTCEGGNEAPVLVVTGAPASAAELAVAVVDLDADEHVHLVLAGLPPTADVVDAAAPPDGAVVGRASSGVEGWDGPCPVPGDPPHRYEVRAYAMAEPVRVVEGTEALAQLESAAIERATLTATYP